MMYRCVRVALDDSLLQCVIERKCILDDVKVFKFDIEMYRIKTASFLSIYSMHQQLGEGAGFPLALVFSRI